MACDNLPNVTHATEPNLTLLIEPNDVALSVPVLFMRLLWHVFKLVAEVAMS